MAGKALEFVTPLDGILPLRMIALVMSTNQPPKILGTCFALRRPTSLLTAHHVIKKHDPGTLGVFFIGTPTLRRVTAVHPHPKADVAILEAEDPADSPIEPATQILTGIHLGETFIAIGFPSELIFGQAGGHPHRMLMGHYQRFMDYESNLHGYRYAAGEMNVPNPKGMSGAPLLRPETPQVVRGVSTVTIAGESYQSVFQEETIERRADQIPEKGPNQYRATEPLRPWGDGINERIPPA